jgi:general secretion pathway protein B
MSYILQALKKSELEREQAASHNVQPLEQVPLVSSVNTIDQDDVIKNQQNHYRFIGLAAAGLLVVIIFVLLADSDVFIPSQRPISVPMSAPATILPPVPVQASELLIEPSVTEIVVAEVVTKSPIAVEQASENVLSLIPNIEISSHIFSSLPERRSIVVNGERLVEGDFVAPKVQVKEITAKGMVVDVNGWSLVIGRSRGWSR